MELTAFALALVAALAATAGLRRENLQLRKVIADQEAPEYTFAPGRFIELGESATLSRPAFDKLEAGIELKGLTVNVLFTDAAGRPIERDNATHALIRGYDEDAERMYHTWARLLGELREG